MGALDEFCDGTPQQIASLNAKSFWTGFKIAEDYKITPFQMILYNDDGDADYFNNTYVYLHDFNKVSADFLSGFLFGKRCVTVNASGILDLADCASDTIESY